MIHSTLEWIYDLKIRHNQSYYSLDNILDKYKDLWYDDWHSNVRTLKYSILKKSDYYTMGMKFLIEYYNKFGPNFDQPVFKVEERLAFKLQGYSFISVLDRLDKVDSGFIVIDYKTGKRELSESSLRDDLQMGIYHLAIRNNFEDSKKISLSHYYLRSGNQVKVDFSTKDEAEIESNIIKSIEKIDLAIEKDAFEAKESNLCNWCYFWKECDKKNGSNPANYI